MDVQHERVGAFGTASLFFVSDSDWYPMQPWTPGKVHVGERKSDYQFDKVVHLVRHPLKTIPSMGAVFPSLNYEFFEDNGLLPQGIKKQLYRNALVWYNINRSIQEQYRGDLFLLPIERFNEYVWHDLLKHLGIPNAQMPALAPTNRATGYRKRDAITWQDLSTLDAKLTKNIIAMTNSLGYKI